MSRNLVIAILVSIALHGGAALSGYLFKKAGPPVAAIEAVPVITIDLPPPPEPEEPEIVEAAGDAPPELADIAPPMQNDVPSAVIDSAFVQQIQAPPPPSLARPSGGNIVIPTTTRPALGAGGAGLGNIFDLKDLDKDPTPTFQPRPPYPFEMRRSGINGEVVVRFVVDSSGGVRNPQIVRSSHAAFEATVLETVVKWKFRPGEKGGAKVNTGNVVIRIPFTLQNS